MSEDTYKQIGDSVFSTVGSIGEAVSSKFGDYYDSAVSTLPTLISQTVNAANGYLTPKTVLSGNDYGIIDITGNPHFSFPKDAKNVYMMKSMYDSLEGVYSKINNLSPEEKKNYFGADAGDDVRIPVSATLGVGKIKSGSYTSDPQALYVNYSNPDFSKTGQKFLESSLHDAGFKAANKTNAGKLVYSPKALKENPDLLKYAKQDMAKLASDEERERAAQMVTGAPGDVKKEKLSKSDDAALNARLSKGSDPAGQKPIKSVIKNGVTIPDASAKKDQLNNTLNNQPVAQISVDNLPSNEGNYKDVNAQLSSVKEYMDKRTKNATYQHSDLGFQSKLDTPAHIRIVTDKTKGKKSEAFSKFETSKVGYIDSFILKTARHVQEEKYYVFQALNGETTSFFFGSKPSVYNFSGIVPDVKNQEWYNDFVFFYNTYLRGSKAIENRTRIFIIYADQMIEGFILNSSFAKAGETTDWHDFSFDMLLVQKTELGYTNPLEREYDEGRDLEGSKKDGKKVDTTKKNSMMELLKQCAGSILSSAPDGFKSSALKTPGLNFDPSSLIKMLPSTISSYAQSFVKGVNIPDISSIAKAVSKYDLSSVKDLMGFDLNNHKEAKKFIDGMFDSFESEGDKFTGSIEKGFLDVLQSDEVKSVNKQIQSVIDLGKSEYSKYSDLFSAKKKKVDGVLNTARIKRGK